MPYTPPTSIGVEFQSPRVLEPVWLYGLLESPAHPAASPHHLGQPGFNRLEYRYKQAINSNKPNRQSFTDLSQQYDGSLVAPALCPLINTPSQSDHSGSAQEVRSVCTNQTAETDLIWGFVPTEEQFQRKDGPPEDGMLERGGQEGPDRHESGDVPDIHDPRQLFATLSQYSWPSYDVM
jgi:hypothetical protein